MPAHRTPSPDVEPHEFGRDGVSGIVSLDRALRAREVSRPARAARPTPGHRDDPLPNAAEVIADLQAAARGRRR
ncbi:hypothetical protein [Granulicoccus phenolivorans]|uniref:hypothetical protein n=1 Tax=Granulicoccus phenolivorans TaxID=266854 RepID=UPI00040F3D61|nr:hypothetical protein [Granulicoccus phenolivorans]